MIHWTGPTQAMPGTCRRRGPTPPHRRAPQGPTFLVSAALLTCSGALVEWAVGYLVRCCPGMAVSRLVSLLQLACTHAKPSSLHLVLAHISVAAHPGTNAFTAADAPVLMARVAALKASLYGASANGYLKERLNAQGRTASAVHARSHISSGC